MNDEEVKLDENGDEIVEAEEIDGDVSDTTEAPKKTMKINGGSVDNSAGLLNLEELINNHIESIEKLKEELKQAREMFDDSFNNDPTYKENLDKVKEVVKAKNSVRQNIAKQPSVASIEQKVKDLRFDISESNKTLSDLLQDYKEQTGATEIETRNGVLLEIVSTAKLVKRSSK